MISPPLQAEDVSVEWLNESMAAHLGNEKITGFELDIIGVGEGFMGQLARVTLTTEPQTAPDVIRTSHSVPTTIIAKFAAQNEATREMAREQRYYHREIGFYQDIGQDVGIPIPDCYYALHIEESNHFVLLLQDLAPSVPSDQVLGSSKQTSREVIENFARLHATWWNSERLAGLDWAQPLFNTQPISEGLALMKYSIAQAEETGRFDRYPEMKRLMYLLPPLFRMAPPPPFPFTLSHGDLRSDNIFCPSDNGGDFAVIDWQLTGMGQPITDIVRWMTQSISIEDRRETEQDLLKLYHDKLVEYGISDYSFKQMMQDYQLNLVLILVMFTMTMDDIDQSPDRAEALFHAMYSRLDAALIDWKVVNLLKVLPYLVPFLKLGVWFRSTFTRKKNG